MQPIQKIMAPTDFSACSSIAVANALALANRLDAELHLFHVSRLLETALEVTNGFAVLADVLQEPDRAITVHMNRLMEKSSGSANVTVKRIQMRALSVPSAILRYARTQHIDLVVMGSHGHRGIKRWLLGSTAEETIRLAPCPVMVCPHAGVDLVPGRMERILVPIDFSDHALAALDCGASFAGAFGGRLLLLHVLPKQSGSRESEVREAEEKLRSVAVKAGRGIPVEIHVVCGHPGREILSFAQEKHCHLVCMSHLGRTGMVERLLGSTSEYVTRSAKAPVLVAADNTRARLEMAENGGTSSRDAVASYRVAPQMNERDTDPGGRP
ncbi:Universal stress protein [Sulfidibacter corallicola]|uniref:Universal stress protein n=1 Tax=Sulfidibacter corallicola TaxID=2818388 RepID=A0A8A4TW22_SULCO|nr:universal stress protein [Sulfidibacter corallicola]QTD53683.1 universal stress protein [Sulfidibacter corallicola]